VQLVKLEQVLQLVKLEQVLQLVKLEQGAAGKAGADSAAGKAGAGGAAAKAGASVVAAKGRVHSAAGSWNKWCSLNRFCSSLLHLMLILIGRDNWRREGTRPEDAPPIPCPPNYYTLPFFHNPSTSSRNCI
jgi:hypothetical protein